MKKYILTATNNSGVKKNIFKDGRSFKNKNTARNNAEQMSVVIEPEILIEEIESDDIFDLNKKITTVLNYIKTSEQDLTKYMWAATIVAVLLDCDFRDSKQKLDEWYEENKEPKTATNAKSYPNIATE